MKGTKTGFCMPAELLGKDREELRTFCRGLGEPAFRGAQLYHAVYAERKFDFARMTNLPAALRERLATEARITLPEIRRRFRSQDASVRYLFALPPDEERRIRNLLGEHPAAQRTSVE